MANNEYVNKVEFGNETLMDITDTTAETGDVIEGQVFYAKSGARSIGTLGDATTSAHGLMSAADKTKLDGIATGATANTGDVTGPNSVTANHVAIFNGNTGKIIKDSGYTIAKSVPSDAVFTDTKFTNAFSRPEYQPTVTDITLQPLINDLRANRFAFLPADQIIIEKTTDGGVTWEDAGVSDSIKMGLFSEVRSSVYLPKIDNELNILCGVRITITAMKYNVPEGTPETEKYNYWNSDYVVSTERYSNIREIYVWINTNADKMKIKVQRAKGKYPNTWVTAFENNNALFQGWSGNDYIRLDGNDSFGGSPNQNTNYWNYRFIFMSAYNANASAFNETYKTTSQQVQEIRGYGTNWWTKGSQYAASDHLYSWDQWQNVTFPAKITAVNYVGKINGVTVPANPQFTDTVPVTDIKINNISILSNQIANIPIASSDSFGVIKVGAGLAILNDRLITNPASVASCKAQISSNAPITPMYEYAATFYGLATAAGDSTQSSSNNEVGIYTDEAKGAIQSLLGINSLLAPVESATTTSQAYNVNDIFSHDGKLYKVTTGMFSGDVITPDTNCAETTIVEELNELRAAQVEVVRL